eukprot:s1337_g4.t1
MSDNILIEQAWTLVENQFELEQLFGQVGSLFLEEQAAKKCLHTMAVSMSVLAGLAPLANGAQSRKSQTTSLLRELGTVIDETCHARERLRMIQLHQPDPAAEEDFKTESLPSNILEGFTPEAFFEAVSGDYSVKKKSGRIWGPGGYGRLANVDEVYPSFLAFGLLSGSDAAKSSHGKSATGINSATSLLNRFFQTGGSSRLTRTAGAYGGAAAHSVSFALVGNAHPTTALGMLDGTSGCHVAAAHERILFYSCPRIQPHSPLPDVVRVSGPRYIWTDMPEELAELAGLTELLRDPERAEAALRPDYDRCKLQGRRTLGLGCRFESIHLTSCSAYRNRGL